MLFSVILYRRFISAVAVTVTILILSASHAQAQQQFLDGLKMTPQTDARHISMLFHKMAGFQPDFEKWIENSDEYKKTPKHTQKT